MQQRCKEGMCKRNCSPSAAHPVSRGSSSHRAMQLHSCDSQCPSRFGPWQKHHCPWYLKTLPAYFEVKNCHTAGILLKSWELILCQTKNFWKSIIHSWRATLSEQWTASCVLSGFHILSSCSTEENLSVSESQIMGSHIKVCLGGIFFKH